MVVNDSKWEMRFLDSDFKFDIKNLWNLTTTRCCALQLISYLFSFVFVLCDDFMRYLNLRLEIWSENVRIRPFDLRSTSSDMHFQHRFSVIFLIRCLDDVLWDLRYLTLKWESKSFHTSCWDMLSELSQNLRFFRVEIYTIWDLRVRALSYTKIDLSISSEKSPISWLWKVRLLIQPLRESTMPQMPHWTIVYELLWSNPACQIPFVEISYVFVGLIWWEIYYDFSYRRYIFSYEHL